MWNRASPVLRSKVHELTGTFQTFFMYKVADRIGTKMMEDNHGNELAIMALLLASLFMVLFVWEQIGEVLYDEIDRFHEAANHDAKTTDLIKGGPESMATLLGWVYAPTTLFRSLLLAVVVWLGQMFSVVVGNYVTKFAENYDSFDAVPITLAVGSFLFLAKMVIIPEPKRREHASDTSIVDQLVQDPRFIAALAQHTKHG